MKIGDKVIWNNQNNKNIPENIPCVVKNIKKHHVLPPIKVEWNNGPKNPGGGIAWVNKKELRTLINKSK